MYFLYHVHQKMNKQKNIKFRVPPSIASEPLNQANNVGAESQEDSLILSVENI